MSEGNFICKFCHKTLLSERNLIRHQNQTKKCLKIQKDVGKNISLSIPSTFLCKYCSKNCSSENRLVQHLFSCKIHLRFQLSEKEKDNQKLKEENQKLREEVVRFTERSG